MFTIRIKKIGEPLKIEIKEENKYGKVVHFDYIELAQLQSVAKAIEKLDNHIFKGYTMRVRR